MVDRRPRILAARAGEVRKVTGGIRKAVSLSQAVPVGAPDHRGKHFSQGIDEGVFLFGSGTHVAPFRSRGWTRRGECQKPTCWTLTLMIHKAVPTVVLRRRALLAQSGNAGESGLLQPWSGCVRLDSVSILGVVHDGRWRAVSDDPLPYCISSSRMNISLLDYSVFIP